MPLRIAQVAPLAEAVPPRLYGGTERVVSWLTEGLAARGHAVTLFASGESETAAELVPVTPRCLRERPRIWDHTPFHVAMLEEVRRRAPGFDLVHFHLDLLPLPLAGALPCAALSTLHGRLDLPGLPAAYAAVPDYPLVSVSDAQRRDLRPRDWAGTVHHGLPPGMLAPGPGGGDLVFLGRIAPGKRCEDAIAIARRAGMPLTIAARIDRQDRDYWEAEVRPLLGAEARFVGEVDDAGKAELLGGAAALLFPIAWPEPFGLVMIEAMACGTPVVATPFGAVPEVVEEGVTGFVARGEAALAAACRAAARLDRGAVRARFEARWTQGRMLDGYEAIYDRLVRDRAAGDGPRRGRPGFAG